MSSKSIVQFKAAFSVAVSLFFPALSSADPVQSTQDFFLSDFGSIHQKSLETHTMPKTIALTGLVLEGRRQGWIAKDSEDYKAVLQKFGFFTPSEIANAPKNANLKFQQLPMGLTEKQVRLVLPLVNVRGMNVTCAACHAGRLYDSTGKPTSQVWMGLPSSSVNFELYTKSLYNGLKLVDADFEGAHKLMRKIFPETSLKERAILKTLVYRTIDKKVQALSHSTDQPLPFSNGGPGLTNGVAALKYTLKLVNRNELQPEFGFTSIPSLGDRFFRTSLLYDGLYSPLKIPAANEKSSWTLEDEKNLSAIVTAFTIPTMGQGIKGVLNQVPHVQQVMHDIIGNYEAPAFPGPIDRERAQRGSAVYAAECMQCHGKYDWKGDRPRLISFPNRWIPQNEMKTDPARWQTASTQFAKQIADTDLSKILRVTHNEGYVAPLLSSLWATAPYLHNGSVPTLWEFMNPSLRTEKFLVGGHHLDMEKVGIKLQTNPATGVAEYPKEVQPWSLPSLFDTRLPGLSNKGHDSPFEKLTEEQKKNLLEFLKLL